MATRQPTCGVSLVAREAEQLFDAYAQRLCQPERQHGRRYEPRVLHGVDRLPADPHEIRKLLLRESARGAALLDAVAQLARRTTRGLGRDTSRSRRARRRRP